MDEQELRPIFQPVRGRFKPFGVPVGKFFIIIGITVAAFLMAITLGSWTHNEVANYTSNERGEIASQYKTIHASLVQLDIMREELGAESFDQIELTDAQKQTISDAQRYGIRANMNDTDLEILVPTTHTVEAPIIPDPVRYLFVALIPVIAIALFTESWSNNRTSLYKEAKRAIRYSRSQRVYKNRPITFVEQECGQSYWSAVASETKD